MSPDGDRRWRFAQSIESLLDLLIGSRTWGMLVELGVLLYEAHDALLVNRRFSTHPLSLPHAVLDVIETGGRAVYLGNLVREAVIFFVLIDLGTQRLGLVKVLCRY